MTTAPARTLTLTAWQLFERLTSTADRQQTGVTLLHCCAHAGTIERRPNGYDFVGAAFEVWCGRQRVWALVDMGDLGLMLYYGADHPFCDVEVVADKAGLVVVEVG